MAMPVCTSWLRWLWPRHERSKSTAQQAVNVERPNHTSFGLVNSDPVNAKPGDFEDIVKNVSAEFDVSDDDIRRITSGFVNQLNVGLSVHGSSIEQIPSFISQLPTGREEGTYLAIDMGGTNLRVCAVTLNGDASYSVVQDKLVIPKRLMTSGAPIDLFLWVAKAVQTFLNDHEPERMAQGGVRSVFKLGFTFSHAVEQQSINRGTLLRWSKGFDIDGVVGRDICELLQEAFDQLALPVQVTALINDTVGTLLTQAYTSPRSTRTVLGAVFGTGTNGAYMEALSRVAKLGKFDARSQKTMAINTEWGNFDQSLEYLPDTGYDREMDAASVNPGFEMFEKRIAGMYLGELLRLTILSLVERPDSELFLGATIPQTSKLYLRWSLDSSIVSYLAKDTSNDLFSSRAEIEGLLEIAPVDFRSAWAVRTIAHAIGKRSARLSAVAIGAILVQTGSLDENLGSKERIGVGVDGSLIELYPDFVTEIRCALRCIRQIGEMGEASVEITVAKDGSGVGAALAAYVASKADL